MLLKSSLVKEHFFPLISETNILVRYNKNELLEKCSCTWMSQKHQIDLKVSKCYESHSFTEAGIC